MNGHTENKKNTYAHLDRLSTEALEELLVWTACGCVHRPQKSPVRVHTEGVESTSAEMVGAVEGL